MITRKRFTAVAAPVLAALACGGGGTVARFAPCASTDTCPSSTVCEAPTSSASIPAFCTWSCNPDDFGGQSCPSDPSGVKGVCVIGLANVTVGNLDQFGFCFQDCSSAGATCPDGETCEQAQPYSGGGSNMTMVCVPMSGVDLLSGTKWQSTTIAPEANSDGVTMSTYTITFGTANVFMPGETLGPFSATFTQTYSNSIEYTYASCVEMTTFTSGEWADVPGAQMGQGAVDVSNAVGSTNRTSCGMSGNDVTGASNIYDDQVNNANGATYTITGNTMMLSGGNGITPYSDAIDWTFTKM